MIQTELGEGDPWQREIMDVQARIEAANLPEEVKVRALKEIERLGQMPAMSPEVGIIRTYVEWILDLPWTQSTEDNLDVRHAARVLERDHYGLPKAKERILEYIAVRSLNPKTLRASRSCAFIGPPGTGKTSLGRSIAEALGRKFVRLSLGGVRDEAEIRGHRRTYIGALPGRILQTMRRAGTINPLFMLDEIDKLGAGLPRRPGLGAARSARPRAEPRLFRPLPGAGVRPFEGHVHHHRQLHRHDPLGAARPHGSDRVPGVY